MLCLTNPEIDFSKDYQVYQITGRLKEIAMQTESEVFLQFDSQKSDPILVRENTNIHLGAISIEDAELRKTFAVKIAGDTLIEMCRAMIPNSFPKNLTAEIPFDSVAIENLFQKNLEKRECPIITVQCIQIDDKLFAFRMIRRKNKLEMDSYQNNSEGEIKYIDVNPNNVSIEKNRVGEYLLRVADESNLLYIAIKEGETAAKSLHFLFLKMSKYFAYPIRILYKEDPDDLDSYEFIGIQEKNLDVIPSTMDEISKLPSSDILRLQDYVIGDIMPLSVLIEKPYSKKSCKMTLRFMTKDGKYMDFYSQNEALVKYFNRKGIQISIFAKRWAIYYDKRDFRIVALYPIANN